MSNHKDKEHQLPKPPGRKEMSRRQFLTYTLGGATAYMAAGAALPMIRFAVDPILQKDDEGDFVKVIEVSKVTEEPQEVTFELKQQDGWYLSNSSLVAWIRRGEDGVIYALSPICKHLGCTVRYNNNPTYPDEYFCPCHGAHYTKEGKQLEVASAPLDEYTVKEEEGWVYLGSIVPNTRVQ
ncbi:ubiquinol-cytochrome c reductase iron-sulfur subunit [Paenibacillus urinalis]|uniref:Ubiquinol-cytochrome c reductase iron-sulfur subunit n=1 Tax=Paenibacillus urinalis TaxID=521520 RepID=A0AAX3MXV3_9BACL|nr:MULTISPECIES: ubiquinol-cytochrome c reductase iron-sulfur subunit [Paenibacillus]WDH81217.1 ubiquinol-cytochrome c reductase iron-sulfur subunit [Paenibacillus urinalis]WDH97268.1 ubiquinol-cytochrome c reductase iron-sulfur subunit [Paenibacillus urinalis]WDI00931.1 ubiquinol-cytochrome c reductase iron-sulfur subunit [Paenibacillus urinalis]GAK40027.1 Rieske (2Fe-3S) domain-containing protein [Paenibacillus sp. TCA20]